MSNTDKLTLSSPDSLARLIQAYTDDSVVLSEHEQIMFQRLAYADELIKETKWSSNEKRAAAISKKFAVSIRTARNDIRQAMELFNSVTVLDKRTGAHIIFHQIDKLFDLLSENRSVAMTYSDQLVKLLKLKIEAYDKLVGDTKVDPRLLQQNNYTFNIGDNAEKSLNLETPVKRSELKALLQQYNLTKAEENKILQEAEVQDDE